MPIDTDASTGAAEGTDLLGGVVGGRDTDTQIGPRYPTTRPPIVIGSSVGTPASGVNVVPFQSGVSATFNNNLAPTPASEAKGVVSGAYTSIPIVYGEARVLGRLFRWITDTWFVGIYVFCRGQVENFLTLSIDGREVDVSANGTTRFQSSTLTGDYGYVQLFHGTASQDLTTDATAAGDVDNWTTDTYANYACAVIQIDRRDFDLRNIPRVEAIIQGARDVYDPRNSPTYAYTNNAALCFAHFLTTYFDTGTSVDDTTLTAVANRADGIGAGNTLSDSSQRHTWGMVVGERPQRMIDLMAFLESAAKVYAWEESGVWYFTADGATSSSHTITAANIVKGSARISSVSAADQPADVRVRFYNRDDNVTGLAEALGNVSGTVSELSAPWIGTHAEAKRLAVERWNHLNNENLLLQFDVPNVGLKMRRGEVVTVTDSALGLSSDDFRITQLETPFPGVWRVYCREYLASTYSDSIASDPVTGTGTPDASAVSPPTLEVTGSSTAVGRLARLDLTFRDATNSPDEALAYPFLDQIRVDVYDATNSPTELLQRHYCDEDTTSISGLPADINFYVEARVISTAGVNGAVSSATITKPTLPTPGAPTGVSMVMQRPVRVGGEDGVRLKITWTDPDYREWLGFRLKRYDTSGSRSGRDPDDTVDLPQGGIGFYDFVAPPASTGGIFGGTRSYQFVLHAVNAAGTESTGAVILATTVSHLADQAIHEFGVTEEISDPVNASGHWEEASSSGNNYILRVRWDIFDDVGLLAGFFVNVYACNAGGTITDLVKRVFIDASSMVIDAYNLTTADELGLAVFDPQIYQSSSGAAPDAQNPTFKVVGDGSSYFRYKIQFSGAGRQLADREIDLYEYGASPDNTVHGPI